MVPGAYEQAVSDAATFYEAELPALLDWRFGEADARRITQPALVVLGETSVALHPRFAETYRLLLDWVRDAEGVIVPGVMHLLWIGASRPDGRCPGAFPCTPPPRVKDDPMPRSRAFGCVVWARGGSLPGRGRPA